MYVFSLKKTLRERNSLHYSLQAEGPLGAIIYIPPPFDSMIKRKVALDRYVQDEQILAWTRMQPSVLGIIKSRQLCDPPLKAFLDLLCCVQAADWASRYYL